MQVSNTRRLCFVFLLCFVLIFFVLIESTTYIYTYKNGIKYAALVTAESLTEGFCHFRALAWNLTARISKDSLSLCCCKRGEGSKV